MNDGNKLEQAKRRDKKVMITDIAIEKVPYIEYKGLTESGIVDDSSRTSSFV